MSTLLFLVGLAHAHPHPACPEEMPPEPAPLAITVILVGNLAYDEIMVACPSGFVGRAPFHDQAARVVPTPDEACHVTLEAPISKTMQVPAGATLLCAPDHHGGTTCVDPLEAMRAGRMHEPPTAGQLTITLGPSLPHTAVEVVCPGGFRERMRFEDRRAVFDTLPAELCRAKLKGALPKSFAVSGDRAVTCTVDEGSILCTPA